MNRREILKLSALTVSGVMSGTLSRALVAGVTGQTGQCEQVFGQQWAQTIRILVDLILPKTDTPSATEAGTHDFVADVYANWCNDQERSIFDQGLVALDAHTVASEGARFEAASPAAQTAALQAAADSAKSYEAPRSVAWWGGGHDPAAPFYNALRDLTITGFYTSEVGATQALVSVPMPGRFDGEYPIAEIGNKSWSA
jgi:hypothetical protein